MKKELLKNFDLRSILSLTNKIINNNILLQ